MHLFTSIEEFIFGLEAINELPKEKSLLVCENRVSKLIIQVVEILTHSAISDFIKMDLRHGFKGQINVRAVVDVDDLHDMHGNLVDRICFSRQQARLVLLFG